MKMKEANCPACGTKVNAHSALCVEECEPKPNDVTLCFYCATICVFDDELNMLEATNDDLADMDDKTIETVIKAQNAILRKNIDERRKANHD